MSLWKQVSLLGGLVFGWFAFATSQRGSATMWLCREHRAEERTYQWVFRSLVTAGTLCVLFGLSGIFFVGDNAALATLCGLLVMAALFIAPITAFYAVLRPRHLRVRNIDRPFLWVENVNPDYLAQFSPLPRQQ
jgi:hypothetical protein